MMSLDEAILHAEEVADRCAVTDGNRQCEDEHRQLAAWLKILKSAKFEYDEAWRIITHPTPDVTYEDRNRAKMILDMFRDSLGRME